MKLLLDRGADINARKKDVPNTALHVAAWHGMIPAASLLIDRGADVNARDDIQGTALHMAAWNGYLDVVEFLLDRGADPWARNMHKARATHVAGGPWRREIVKLLLERRAKIGRAKKFKHFVSDNKWKIGAGVLVAGALGTYLALKKTDKE